MAWMNRLIWMLGGTEMKANFVIVGISGCGKSTIMHQIKPYESQMLYLSPSLPICCPAEKFITKSLTFVAFTLDEIKGFGNPWEDFYRDCTGLIFVIDGTDRYNIPLVKEKIEKLFMNPLIVKKNIPFLFLVNKSDHGASIHCMQITEMLNLHETVGRKTWCIFPISAITGDGLNEAFDWFSVNLRKQRRFSV